MTESEGRRKLNYYLLTGDKISAISDMVNSGTMWPGVGVHHLLTTDFNTPNSHNTIAYMWLKRGIKPDPHVRFFMKSNNVKNLFRFYFGDYSSPALVLASILKTYGGEFILN